jgi:hypothetical protein
MTEFDRRSSGPAAPSGPPVRGVRWPEPTDDDRRGWNAPPAPRRFPDNASEPSANADPHAQWPTAAGGDPTSSDQWYDEHSYDGAAQTPAYGRPAWFAVAVMVAVTAIGVVIDVLRDATGGVNVAIIVGALLAILIVRRLAMFPVVIAPPLVYILGSAAVLYLRSGGPHNRTVLIDIATNWLVYGFPAMAAATAVVLIIAGIRMVVRR